MAKQVVLGAMLKCSFGAAPCPLVVIPAGRPIVEFMPAANITDFAPITNIASFSMCTTQSNPAVAAATTAALGVPTPAPCVPVIPAPWAPGSPTVLIANMAALNDTSKCTCTWGGMIEVTYPGTTKTDIP